MVKIWVMILLWKFLQKWEEMNFILSEMENKNQKR